VQYSTSYGYILVPELVAPTLVAKFGLVALLNCESVPDRNSVISFAIPPTRHFVAEKAFSSSQIPLFVSITITRLLHYLRIHTPHIAYIGSNLTSRAHQFDPKRRMPPLSNVSRMAQNIVINAVKTLLKHIATS